MQVVNPPKILNFNLIDNFKIVYEDENLTSNPKQTKKRNFKQFCKKFLRFFCFDAGDEDDYIITNSFSPPGFLFAISALRLSAVSLVSGVQNR